MRTLTMTSPTGRITTLMVHRRFREALLETYMYVNIYRLILSKSSENNVLDWQTWKDIVLTAYQQCQQRKPEDFGDELLHIKECGVMYHHDAYFCYKWSEQTARSRNIYVGHPNKLARKRTNTDVVSSKPLVGQL